MHLLAVDLLRLIRSLQDKRPPFFRFSFCTCRRSIIHRTAQNTHTSKISADVRRNPVNIYYSGCISICQAFFLKKAKRSALFWLVFFVFAANDSKIYRNFTIQDIRPIIIIVLFPGLIFAGSKRTPLSSDDSSSPTTCTRFALPFRKLKYFTFAKLG